MQINKADKLSLLSSIKLPNIEFMETLIQILEKI